MLSFFLQKTAPVPQIQYEFANSLSEYLALLKALESKHHFTQDHLSHQKKKSYLKAYCWICKLKTSMLIDQAFGRQENGVFFPNFRERVICPKCRCGLRIRMSAQVWTDLCKPQLQDAIYMTEAVTPLYSFLHSQYPNLIGSEFSETDGEYIKRYLRQIKNEDLQKLSFADSSFKHILSFDVLEHLPDYQQALSECFRVLQKTGHLFISFPFHDRSQEHVTRASLDFQGKVVFHGEPVYHGDPIRPNEGILVFKEYGWNILEEIKQIGFSKAQAVICYSREFGYIGTPQILFWAQK